MNMQLDNRFHKLEVAMRQVQADIKDIKKMAGKETQNRIEALEEFATYADNLLTQLNHALPDTPEPKLKQLEQSVFDGVFDWVKSAAINPNGAAYLFSVNKDDFYMVSKDYGFQITGKDKCQCIGLGYDTTNWQNSLIERDKVELTGSDLCRAMLARGDKAVLCLVIDNKETGVKRYDAINKTSGRSAFMSYYNYWQHATPINNQGEPLTATDVGL